MSKNNEQEKSSPDLEQILSERDALRGMNDSLEEELALVKNDVRVLLTLANLVAILSITNIGALKVAFDALTNMGMGPQLDELSELLSGLEGEAAAKVSAGLMN